MLNRVVEEVIEDGTSQSELLWYIMISTTTTTTQLQSPGLLFQQAQQVPRLI